MTMRIAYIGRRGCYDAGMVCDMSYCVTSFEDARAWFVMKCSGDGNFPGGGSRASATFPSRTDRMMLMLATAIAELTLLMRAESAKTG